MPSLVRVTVHVARVVRVFLDAPDVEHYGFALMERLRMNSGRLYPVLARLEAAGWISSHPEVIDPKVAKRPPRRYYRLTVDGMVFGREALEALAADITPRPE